MIGLFNNNKLDVKNTKYITTVSDSSVIKYSIADWDENYGRIYSITALKAGESTLTVSNIETGESTAYTFYVSENKSVYNFNNLPAKEYESGKKTNFYNYSGMVVNEIKCTPNYEKSKIKDYTVTMTVYNKEPIYGAVTSYTSDGQIYDYYIVDRMKTQDTSFTSSVKSLYYQTGDLHYLLKNGFYYSGKSITKESHVELEVPVGGKIQISNNINTWWQWIIKIVLFGWIWY